MLEMLLNVKVSIHRIFRTDLTVLECVYCLTSIGSQSVLYLGVFVLLNQYKIPKCSAFRSMCVA